MKKSEIKVGSLYFAKVSNKIVTVRVDEISKQLADKYRPGGWRYDVTNLVTNRKITFKSAAKFRSLALEPTRLGEQETERLEESYAGPDLSALGVPKAIFDFFILILRERPPRLKGGRKTIVSL